MVKQQPKKLITDFFAKKKRKADDGSSAGSRGSGKSILVQACVEVLVSIGVELELELEVDAARRRRVPGLAPSSHDRARVSLRRRENTDGRRGRGPRRLNPPRDPNILGESPATRAR